MTMSSHNKFIVELLKIPNLLTLLRVLLIPLLFYLAYTSHKFTFAAVFIFMGLTDFFDGYLARMLNQVSLFGAKFDSFADDLVTISLIFWLYLLFLPFVSAHFIIFIIIYMLYFITLFFQYFVSKHKSGLHLHSAKIYGFFVYSLVLLFIFYRPIAWLFYIASIFVIYSYLENIIKYYNGSHPNHASFFSLLKKNHTKKK